MRLFSKIVCVFTLFLIFAGGMVTSTGSGLAVPDWPLSYGKFFPPMVGGVFYEHGHRMIASLVGLLTLILTIWLGLKETRKWLRVAGIIALCAVVLQGILGGLTVLYYLPTAISVSHGILAQTFFLITIFIAYGLSAEREKRVQETQFYPKRFLAASAFLLILIYIQLVFGALMRHTGSGLAIPDFPTMGGQWIPQFDRSMLFFVNDWRFENNYDAVAFGQVFIHFLHRSMAVLILFGVCILNAIGLKCKPNRVVFYTIMQLDVLIVLQILLGITAVLTQKSPVLTSIHVVTGAAILGQCFLLILRVGATKLSLSSRQLT